MTTTKAKPVTKSPVKAPAKAPTKTPAKARTSVKAKTPAKIQTPVKAKTPKNSYEMMLSRVEIVRSEQLQDGNFDCFGRATEGYCDQGDCTYHAECLSISRLFHG